MDKIIWKSFALTELFEFSSGNTFALKDYKLFDEKIKNSVEVVTSSKDSSNNKFILKDDIPINCPIYYNSLTINRNGSIGYCIYHKDEYIIPTGDSYTIEHKNVKLKNILSVKCNMFLSKLLTNIFTGENYGYNYKVNSERFDREILLLPCLEVKDTDDFIWEENGKFYTLAVEYINKLMNKAKELKEQKTIRLYEKEKAKYEKEYIEEKKNVVWKGFELGGLFSWSSRKDLSLKEYNLSDEYEKGYVEVITGSKSDKNQYIFKDDLPNNYPVYNNCLCLNCNGSIGYSFYYKNDIVSPTSSVHILLHKNKNLESIMTESINLYLAKNITKIFTAGCYNRTSCLIDNPKFEREMMVLPCLEVKKDNDYIWEDSGKYYKLAINFISYLYLQGRCNYYQKLIDKYTYQY